MPKFMAVYTGTPPQTSGKPFDQTRIPEGMAAWHAWMAKYADVIDDNGGPLGKTKEVGPDGIKDVTNLLTGYVVFNADSIDAAAQMFVGHPHFSIFPGDAVQVMPVMPVPTM